MRQRKTQEKPAPLERVEAGGALLKLLGGRAQDPTPAVRARIRRFDDVF